MDTTDPEIMFDESGQCNHCAGVASYMGSSKTQEDEGWNKLKIIAGNIRKEGKGKEFDCIIGLSGGVDSSYLAYLVTRELGLRPLVVHIDCGWNSELAVKNIENITRHLNIELHTLVVNWEEMKDLQRSFIKASLMDLDIPQDHAIFAGVYKFADQNNVKYAFNGVNYSSELIMPSSWGFQAMDLRHIKAIHSQFGEKKLKDFPRISFFKRYLYFSLFRNMKIISPLNMIDYNKEKAIELMSKELGWRYYGGKHHESRFTKFYQNYYLPHKFGIDKRRAHLSSLVAWGQMTREEALMRMGQPLYDEKELVEDLDYVAKKLDWTPEELSALIDQPPGSHRNYTNNDALFKAGIKMKRFIGGILNS